MPEYGGFGIGKISNKTLVGLQFQMDGSETVSNEDTHRHPGLPDGLRKRVGCCFG